MQSEARDVDSYLKEVPNNRREALMRLRELCRDILTGYEESMQYGMPSYKKDAEVEVAFANQKRDISLYILKQDVLDKHRLLLAGLNVGKGCIRYSNPEKIDFEIVAQLLADSYGSEGQIC